MRSDKRRKVDALEMKCLRSWLECHEWKEFRNEEVRRRAGI